MSRNANRKVSELAGRAGSTRRLTLWIETSVVLLFMVGSILSWAACWLFWGNEYLEYDKQFFSLGVQSSATFGMESLESMFAKLRFIPIILFIIWRSGDAWSRFGLVKPKLGKDVLIGVGLSIVLVAAGQITILLFHSSSPFTWWNLLPASSPPSRTILLIASNCAIGFSEELGYRAYLIPRLEELTGATWKGILLSSVLFGLAHLHKGMYGVTNSFLSAAIWGVSFCMTRRIWPAAISHSLNDFILHTHINSLIGS
jgi:membrane protease YdiL (CAAX protease family)